jgi:hypothetical protein
MILILLPINPAREADRQAAEAAGVWTTPFLVDRQTAEGFIGETTLELLRLRLRQRGWGLDVGAPAVDSHMLPIHRSLAPDAFASAEPKEVEVYYDYYY